VVIGDFRIVKMTPRPGFETLTPEVNFEPDPSTDALVHLVVPGSSPNLGQSKRNNFICHYTM